MKKTHQKIYLLIAALSLIALIFSVLILIQKTSQNQTINNFCSAIDSNSKCNIVQESEYGKIFGIDNPWLGIAGFSVLLIISIINYFKDNYILRKMIMTAGILSGSLAIYFLYVQKYLIGAYCIFCVIVDMVSIILLLSSFYILFKEKLKK